MSDLQTTFYIMGIVYMAIMFLLMIVAVVAVIVIKRKVTLIQRSIEARIQGVTDAFHAGEEAVERAKTVINALRHR